MCCPLCSCWGTLTEQLGKLTDSVYVQSLDKQTLFINLFASSTVRWGDEAGSGANEARALSQASSFPYDDGSGRTTTLTVEHLASEAAAIFTLMIRVPGWAMGHNTVLLNNQTVSKKEMIPGTYLELSRRWSVGDTVVCKFPMELRAAPINDWRPEFNSTTAWMYGPLLLVGLTSDKHFTPAGDPLQPGQFMRQQRNADGELLLRWEATERPMAGTAEVRQPHQMAMMPLYQVTKQRYTTYFETSSTADIPAAPGWVAVPSRRAADLILQGQSHYVEYPRGATANASGTGNDRITIGNVTIDNQLSPAQGPCRMVIGHRLVGKPGLNITALSFAFQYASEPSCIPETGPPGYGPALVAKFVDAESWQEVAQVFESGSLCNYSWIVKANTFSKHGFSPPVVANLSGLSVPNDRPVYLQLEIVGHFSNVWVPVNVRVGFGVSVQWGSLVAAPSHGHGHRHDDAGAAGGLHWPGEAR